MTETLPQIGRKANDQIIGYLEFRARLYTQKNAENMDRHHRELCELLLDLAQTLPPPIDLTLVHAHPVLAAPNGVIFIVAGSNGLLKFRLPLPFPEVELSVGLLPAQHIGANWCYCDPRGEPVENLEAWIKSAFEYALQTDGIKDKARHPIGHRAKGTSHAN